MKQQDRQSYYAKVASSDHQQQIELIRSQPTYQQSCETSTNNISWFYHSLKQAFLNPFTFCLLFLAVVSFLTTRKLPNDEPINNFLCLILFVMVMISGMIRLVQEHQAHQALKALHSHDQDHYRIIRASQKQDVAMPELQVGDKIFLNPGDRVPADVVLQQARGLFVSTAPLTGESQIEAKHSEPIDPSIYDSLLNYPNILYKGSTVILGQAQGQIIAVGQDTLYGCAPHEYQLKCDDFANGANQIALVLIRFMVILIILVFGLDIIIRHNVAQAFFFAISIGIGLIPEMLPMVIAGCLSYGTHKMRKKNTIIRNINSMQDFGSMDMLCVDKTGTLTNDRLTLEYYMDILGNESMQVLDYAYLNSCFHQGLDNPIDIAIKECSHGTIGEHLTKITAGYQLIEELAFDYQRKFSSIIIQDKNSSRLMITKGDIQSVMSICTHINYQDQIIPLDDQSDQSLDILLKDMLDIGMKIIAIAYKPLAENEELIEDKLILLGFIAFFDAPKQSAQLALDQLRQLKVKTKILTGDRLDVAQAIAKRLGFKQPKTLSGTQLNQIDDTNINIIVENIDIFAEMTPAQKAQIIAILQENGHTVGYLGDGINDIPALCKADVGITVDNAISAAKDAADVILLAKDLNILGQGIIEGRKTFIKMVNYIKITASSNFGNILSIIIASIFLPFMPMNAIQILLLNLLYDCLCIILVWDNVDIQAYQQPQRWSGKTLSRFMLTFGPISSLFDIITFILLYLIIAPAACGNLPYAKISDPQMQQHFVMIFQTGWFLLSMWTQLMIIQLLRTKKIPFLQSRPSKAVMIGTLLGIIIFTSIPYSFIAKHIDLAPMPWTYYIYLVITVCCYLALTSFIKIRYLKKYHDLS